MQSVAKVPPHYSLGFFSNSVQGLCAYVLANVSEAKKRGIVIGHDHRHNSEHWSRLTAAVFAHYQVRVYLHRGLVHTPLLRVSLI